MDGTGKVLDTTVVYPTLSQAKREAAITALGALIRRHGVQCIAIGNGTASRETEEMTSELIARYPGPAYGRQRGGGFGLLGVQAGGGGVSPV
ncbi:MAG: hypothetical protein V8S89_05805 [Oscillospiraceae bacterium]